MTCAIRIGIAVSMIALASLPARAEAVSDRSPEIGADWGALASLWTKSSVGGELRVSVPVNERDDVETFGGIGRPWGETIGFYGVMFKRHLRRTDTRRGLQPYFSVGGAGVIAVAGSDSFVTPPLVPLVGGGVEQRIHQRISVRVEAQALVAIIIPVGVRVMAGVSVPIGRRLP